MADSAHNSDLILTEARRSLQTQRAGGRRARYIGQRSRTIRRQHRLRKLMRIVIAIMGIMLGATVLGMIVNGIGWEGIILSMIAMIVAVAVLARWPRLDVPTRSELAGSDVKSLVGRTEMWLERQRPALPALAVQLVDQIGVQLDALGLQLDGLNDNTPAAVEVRKLVGEHLPELISTYTSIPRHLRSEDNGGGSPDQRLNESLGRISGEIDSVTRQLASGAIDNLAIKTRYLDYKYGAGPEEAN